MKDEDKTKAQLIEELQALRRKPVPNGIVGDINKRKQTDKTLVETNDRYKMLFEGICDAVFVHPLKQAGFFNFIAVNDVACKLLGYTREELLKRSPRDICAAEDVEFHSNSENKITFQKKRWKMFRTVHIAKSGKQIQVEINSRILELEGRPVIVSLSRDITERVQADRKLHESEERYRSLMEQMPDGVYRSTQEGKFLDVNSALVKMLGYASKKDLLAVDIKKELYFNELERTGIVENLKQSGNENIDVFRLRHLDGHTIWVEDHGRLIYDNSGHVLYHEGVLRDITERKETNERIAELAEFNKSILSSAPVGIVTVNKEGKVTSANATFLEMMGSPSLKEVLKVGINLPIFTNEQISTHFQMAFRNGQTFEIKKLPFTSYWGKELFVNLKGVPQQTKDGRIFGVIIVVNDVTTNVLAEEENAKLEIQLRRAQKLETIGTLAGGIAHDFNNILAPIMGFTELALLKVGEREPIVKDLNQILKGTHRAKELVEQILLFSKQSEKEHKPISLQSIVKEALKLLRPSIPATIEIQQRLDSSCSKVLADATQMHQVVVNLCTNAWQSMDKRGVLTIELSQIEVAASIAKLHPKLTQSEYARLSVIDTGCGMDEDTLERIFEPFFTTKEVDKGTGLGLSMVHGIVRNHHGDVLVYSELEKGSAFHVYLPVLEFEAEVNETKVNKITGGTEHVLIVDDEPAISEMVKMMLENFGYKADVCKTGLAAIEAFEQQPKKYDLLVSDLTMPQMTGLDLADQLHKENPDLPVIIMTGFGDALTKPTLERYGIKYVLSKPVAIQKLAAFVRKALDE